MGRSQSQLNIATLMVLAAVAAAIVFVACRRLGEYGGLAGAFVMTIGLNAIWATHARGRQRAAGRRWDDAEARAEKRKFYAVVYAVLIAGVIGVFASLKLR